MRAARTARRFLEPRDAEPIPPSRRPAIGITAATAASWLPICNGRAEADKLVGAVMVSVELPGLAPRVSDKGEIPQVANGAGPLTAQLRFTCPENPFCPINVSASVVCPPVFRVRVEDAEAKVKSGAKANVAVTACAEFMVTPQPIVPPVQPPLH